MSQAELWSPESPCLYPVRIRLGQDEVRSYFAMRSFGTGIDSYGHACLTLNDKPYFFHGVLDQGYWPESLMTAPSDESMIFDIVKMKETGFTMLRKHAKIEPLRWYYHCDRLGMVVWQDMVNRPCYVPTCPPVCQSSAGWFPTATISCCPGKMPGREHDLKVSFLV